MLPSNITRTQAAFGAALNAIREKVGNTVPNVASQCGIPNAELLAIEAGSSLPSAKTFKRLSGRYPSLRHFGADLALARAAASAPPSSPPSSPPVVTAVEPAPPTPSLAFTAALRAEREKVGMSREDIATLCEVTRNAVFEWEEGASAPILAHYEKLLALFPELVMALPPPARDIPKPAGSAGRGWPLISNAATQAALHSPAHETPAPMPSPPSPAPLAPLSSGLVWLLRIDAMKKSTDYSKFRDLLRSAADEKLSVADLLALFGDVR